MKILKILFTLVFVAILLAGIGIFLFLKSFDITKYKPKIIEEASKALGREVDLRDIALNFSPGEGVTVDIRDLTVKDNPDFSKDDFLFIKDINLGIDVFSYLAKKQILVSQVKIRSPQITLIRNASGQLNAQTLKINVKKKNGEKTSLRPSVSLGSLAYAAEGEPQNETSKGLDLLIRSIELEDGILIYKDEMFNPPMLIEIPQIDLTIDDFSLDEPFDFLLEASLFSQGKNISATGKADIDAAAASFSLKDVKIDCDLSTISVGKLEESIPMLKSAGLEGGMKGRLNAVIHQMVTGKQGLSSLSLTGSLTGGKIKTKYLALPFNNIETNFEITEKDAKIKEASLNLGVGTLTAEGGVEDYLKEQKFSLNIVSSGVDLREIISQGGQSVSLEGKLFADFNIEGKGFNPNQKMFNSLSGDGLLEVKEGKLIGINVLRVVLDKISMIPNLVEDIEENLPEKYKEQLKSEDTMLKKVKMVTKIADGHLTIDNSEIRTDAFLLSGAGILSFNQELDLSASLSIPKDLTESMVASAQPLSYLVDETGEIAIPLSVSGKIPNLAFLPDLEYLGKKIIATRGREELQKVLDDVFGREEEATPAETAPGTEAPSGTAPPVEKEKEKSPEQQLIEGVLDKIFK